MHLTEIKNIIPFGKILIFYYIKNILIKIGISDKLNAQQYRFVFSILSKNNLQVWVASIEIDDQIYSQTRL